MRRLVSSSILGLAAFLGVYCSMPSLLPATAQERVRAKVGLQVRSGERSSPAKTTDTVKAGDFVRVYVIPEEDAYVYVVYNDGKKASLLNAQEATTKLSKGVLVALPSPKQFYQVDGTSDKEAITIVCSPQEIPDITSILTAENVPPQRWLPVEKDLLDKSKIDVGQKAETPFRIAGNVRSLENDPFLDKLQIYSGKTLMVKKYELHVQK